MNAAARRDYWLLSGLAVAISIGALIFYYHQGAILLYGDAVAHINIARRVFDSRNPGLFQLGTVWLPLPHLLDIPFIVNGRMWQTGLGASVPSIIAYVAGTLGVYRLVSGLASRSSAWIAFLIYGLNPNLIYMQATAMGESLYLALFVWAAVYFAEFVRQVQDDHDHAAKSLKKCGLVVSAAMMVRYDGWFLAAVIAVCAVVIMWRHPPSRGQSAAAWSTFYCSRALPERFFWFTTKPHLGMRWSLPTGHIQRGPFSSGARPRPCQLIRVKNRHATPRCNS